MQGNEEKSTPDVLDSAQLIRIEAVHRGFLYQHLYAVGCLLLAQKASMDTVTVELDEDIELNSRQERIYVQVKTRLNPIIPSDVSGALARFADLRNEHTDGRRQGSASFIIVANQAPGPHLQKMIEDMTLSADVRFVWPQSNAERHPALPPAWDTVADAAAWCITQAEQLNFSLLSPESLIWKLAGLVQLAATGGDASGQHAFYTKDLPALFEQLIVQLQDFPAPPALYRPLREEPSFVSDERVRIICGLSGAGKTAWAAQAAQHSSQVCAYYDAGDLPGPALASTLVRELAARFATQEQGGLRRILLPGASGVEALRTFDTVLRQRNDSLLLVLDNAHRIPVENLRDVLHATTCIHFVLLCQPHDNVRQLEAMTGFQRESLQGWDIDTVAAAVTDLGGFASALGYEQLRSYTGGLPLYVESAARVAAEESKGDIDTLCAELRQQENSTETAQEVILSRVYQGFEPLVQNALALFSLSDVGLSRDEVSEYLARSLNIPSSGAATLIKKMRATGTIENYGNQTLKVHDAVRALGLQHLTMMDADIVNNALLTLKDLLIESLHQARDTSRFSLLTQIYIKLNDVMTLIDLSGEELFYEMGITVDIMESLKKATASNSLAPVHKFWALDGLVFSELKDGVSEQITQWLDAMKALLTEHEFGYRERTAYTMKRMLFLSEKGDHSQVHKLAEDARPGLPDEEHARIFDYTHAIALWRLKKYKQAETLCRSVVDRYYALFGITPRDVMGKNSDVLWTIINQPKNVHEHIKHLADALELLARINDAQGKVSPFVRIHAMKFYNMTAAPESLVRVGQDLADEFVARKDYVGAREVMEQHVLPVVNEAGLVQRLVQVRSQYAVILALVGEHGQAEAEMRRIEPYFEGLTGGQRQEFEDQSNYIAQLAYKAAKSEITRFFGVVGRNEPCPCGSGVKYKKCHGA
ncbi:MULTISPECIES: SEC-C metal-binding domain-containing protein [Rahnella]|uniref:SEC-C domain-containing protein n=1 Tax=Rahnella laticis TaxID=2787622 RepID=A0ABS0EAN9_9GAMM|nr:MULTISPECIES: SEC-C metal-binding domain-containing protein [Rahnella]MBF7981165.1 SEC-C domain-containing protein [Rahnella laticis]MBF8001073.1 SEC-C domain-containing protein [Rahnella sp. LAC-M12]